MKQGLLVVGAGFMVLMTSVSLFILGCGGGSANSGSSGSDGDFTGTLSFQNESGEALCGVQMVQSDSTATYEDRVESGESIELEIESNPDNLFVTSCDEDGFLYAGSVSLDGGTYAFADTDPQTYQQRFDYLRELNRMNTNPVMVDASVTAEMQEAVEMRARDQNWTDNPTVTLIASDDWSTLRHNVSGIITGRRIAGMVGHRFPDGHCSIQVHTFRQEHDGNDYSGSLRYEGTAGNIYAGCTMVDWMENQAGGGGGGSASSGGGGGGCSNTCSSANDGDCDDGGPGADYDVCEFGTDCGDCGER